MIKNILYSLFLHFLLLSAIYANFNLNKPEEKEIEAIAIAMVSIDGNQEANQILKQPSIKKELKKPKEKIKKEQTADKKSATKSPKESKKDEVKTEEKKATESKPEESIAKPVAEPNKKEFKEKITPEKAKSEKIALKEKEQEKKKTENEQDSKKSKQEDLGAKEKEEEELPEEEEAEEIAVNNSENTTNNIENLNLSAREKFNIQSQLRRCYNRAIDETKLESDLKITVQAKISEDGYINSNLKEIIDKERYNNPKEPSYKIAIDNASRALELCSPLRNLPLDKYYIWKEVVFDFGKEEISN